MSSPELPPLSSESSFPTFSPLSSGPSYHGGESSEAMPDWLSELYGSEPIASDPAYELYEEFGGSFDLSSNTFLEDPLKSDEWKVEVCYISPKLSICVDVYTCVSFSLLLF
jgi:hypothetical protein